MTPEQLQLFIYLAAMAIGAAIGSFLNVVIYRVPRGMSVNQPRRSFCPMCKTPIAVWHNIPILSWLWLRGKCAACKTPISARYLWVELLTMLTFAGVVWYWGPFLEAPMRNVLLCLWLAILIPIVLIDLELMIIPTVLTWLGTGVGFLMAWLDPAFIGEHRVWPALKQAGWGWFAGFVGIWLVVELGKKAFGRKKLKLAGLTAWHLQDAETDEDEVKFFIGEECHAWSDLFSRDSDRIVLKGGDIVVDGKDYGQQDVELYHLKVCFAGKEFPLTKIQSLSGHADEAVLPREAMGMGDAHLMGMVGALLGPAAVLFTVFVGALTGIVVAVMGRLGFGTQIPFGPCLAVGALTWMLGGERAWEWYLNLPSKVWQSVALIWPHFSAFASTWLS